MKTTAEEFVATSSHLVRHVIPRRGKPYRHRCPRESFEQVCHAAEELGNDGFTLESLAEHEAKAGRYIPFTHVAVALAFLRERGILDVEYRQNRPACEIGVHLLGMCEFTALEYTCRTGIPA